MIRKWFGITALMVTAVMLSILSSCARSQQLVGITVSPATATFGGIGAQIQFRAVGSYIHPPENKDVTQQATWAIEYAADVHHQRSRGMLTATGDCGCGGTCRPRSPPTKVWEEYPRTVRDGMTANVVCDTGTGGGTGNPLLSVTFLNSVIGTV